MHSTSCWPSLCHNQTISLTLLPLLLLVLASWTCHQKSQRQLNCLFKWMLGMQALCTRRLGLCVSFHHPKQTLDLYSMIYCMPNTCIFCCLARTVRKKLHSQFEKEAFTSLAKAKAKAAAKGKAKAKPKSKAKAKPVAKSQQKLTKPHPCSKPKYGYYGKPPTKGPFGCLRCRGNIKGCSQCLQPSYNGLRFSSRQQWCQWEQARKAQG